MTTSLSGTLHDATERTQLTSNNQFELMLFRLGEAPDSERRELFGINVFKVREILVMPKITGIANAPPQVLGVAEAVAGGAILALVAQVMMPHAFEGGGRYVSLSTIAGFLIAFLLSTIGVG